MGNKYQSKETPLRWVKKSLPAIHPTRLISQIYKELKKLCTKGTNNPMSKWENELNRQF
jgi:hypothetical protein